MITYFYWWYYEEPKFLWHSILNVISKTFASFSVGLLLSTLFDPWKKDVIYVENASLDIRLRIMIENLISRFAGFLMRIFTIIAGFLVTIITILILITAFLAWLLMPVIIFALLVNGIRMVLNG